MFRGRLFSTARRVGPALQSGANSEDQVFEESVGSQEEGNTFPDEGWHDGDDELVNRVLVRKDPMISPPPIIQTFFPACVRRRSAKAATCHEWLVNTLAIAVMVFQLRVVAGTPNSRSKVPR